MKLLILFSGLILSLSVKSQTTVYSARPDGTLNKSSYEYYIHATGKILKSDTKTPPGIDTVQNVTLNIISNKVFVYWFKVQMNENPQSSKMDKVATPTEIGYLTADKKIISLKNGKPSDEALAPYIKDNKIYSSDNKIIAFIEGQEIYGAASYLLSL
ncbi:MAG TPA: hypothetical protein VN026_16925 [Bacteroidia bacterium]|jgi:hypothetical protein|nr:hypothetical protein [Bacteroidia bacterium]